MIMKRKIARYLMALLFLLVTGAWLMHEFYVSLTELRHNPVSEMLEVSMRIFPDDMDRALLEKSGIQTELATETEHPRADSLLREYLLDHLKVEINQQEIQLNYLGKETEGNAIWCYLESAPVSDPEHIRIENTLLLFTFPDQVNIIQVYVGKWNKGLLLNRDNPSGNLNPK